MSPSSSEIVGIRNVSVCLSLNVSAARYGIVPGMSVQEAFGVISGFGVFACLIAILCTSIRKYVYHDQVRGSSQNTIMGYGQIFLK